MKSTTETTSAPRVRNAAPASHNTLRRACDCAGKEDCDCDKGEGGMKRSAAGPAPAAAPPIVGDVLRSDGQSLDPALRERFEPRFGVDFGNVRIHTGAEASASARAVNASAYTVGRSIVFGEGRFAPHTNEGARLLAHELTHVAQDGGGAATSVDAISAENDPSEREAHRVAEEVTT